MKRSEQLEKIIAEKRQQKVILDSELLELSWEAFDIESTFRIDYEVEPEIP